MNILLFFVKTVIVFGSLVIVSKKLGKEGVFTWVGVACVLANILTCKCVDLFGMSATLGTILFGSIFLATDILTENYSVDYAKKAVWAGVFSSCIFIIITQLAILFIPNELDITQDSFETLFGLAFRISLASISMFIISNRLDIYLFTKIKERTEGKYLWLRNTVATSVSQCVENFLFYILAFVGTFPINDILMMACTCCIVEIIISILDTPFIYLAVNKVKE